LGEALQNISTFMHLPQFRTKLGKGFALADFRDALEYKGSRGEKAVFTI
jgi:hypothetical protein